MNDVHVILMDLPVRIHGFVCLGSDYNPCIVINSRLTFEQQQKTFRHEMDHILSGQMDDENYFEYGDPA
jgi:Zn-dependent peptidase ImmA (M78 family)